MRGFWLFCAAYFLFLVFFVFFSVSPHAQCATGYSALPNVTVCQQNSAPPPPPPPAAAHSVDVNFSPTAFVITGLGADATDGVSAPKWNNIVGPNGGTLAALKFSDNTASQVAATLTSSGSFVAATTPPIFSQFMLIGSTPGTLTLTGLAPNGSYRLVLYGQNGSYNSRGTTFTIVTGTGLPIAGSNASTSNTGSATYLLNSNYVVFSVIADSTGKIVVSYVCNGAAMGGNNGEGDFNGFQLVQ